MKSALLPFALSFCSVSAQAHVVLSIKDAPAGSYQKLNFGIGHGCQGSATTSLTMTIPAGILLARPQIHFNWQSTVKQEKLATPFKEHGHEINMRPTEVTFKAKEPLADDHADEVVILIRIAPDATGELSFPVTQTCEKGQIVWNEKGAHAEYPAPKLNIIHPHE